MLKIFIAKYDEKFLLGDTFQPKNTALFTKF